VGVGLGLAADVGVGHGGGAGLGFADWLCGVLDDADGGGAVGRVAALTTSLATDLPAAIAPERTPIARLMRLIVSAIVVAETRPARIVSSTPSAKRWKTPPVALRVAYLDSRNSM
jgi:hypothetical protein